MGEDRTSCGSCHHRHSADRTWDEPIRCAHFGETFPQWRFDCPAWVTQALTEPDDTAPNTGADK